MLKLEARPEQSRLMSIGSPLLALLITVVVGVILFVLLGKDPVRGLYVFFVEPPLAAQSRKGAVQSIRKAFKHRFLSLVVSSQ